MGISAQNSSCVHWCRRQVTFNRVPEKVPEEAWGSSGSHQTFTVTELRNPVEPDLALNQSLPFNSRKPSWGVSFALGFAARFRKICKNKTLQLLGIPPRLIFYLISCLWWYLMMLCHFSYFSLAKDFWLLPAAVGSGDSVQGCIGAGPSHQRKPVRNSGETWWNTCFFSSGIFTKKKTVCEGLSFAEHTRL